MSSTTTTLARLTHISTQTLTLLLERQRLEALGQSAPASTTSQIQRNLGAIRAGVLDMEASSSAGDATRLLRDQYERMRGMLGRDGDAIEPLKPLAAPRAPTPTKPEVPSLPVRSYEPYTDDPVPSPGGDEVDHDTILAQQRQAMDEQDTQLEHLGHSIRRQHDISLQIGDELDVHAGLLEQLDADVENTGSRMGAARTRLDRVAQGARRNGSTLTIAGLIFILLILIIVFKT
ncbi:hypothetical protein EXIGLDRAFT_641802 [Exidia glandulosa HHB12029]|uniref:t-SNARE coiled-coil homology domain-containing protein n=1 Tax=Exidia glandulosa HHB12029 TaxID=1314781 RepID=A0A165LMN2_EXIGL|nr:hypothetical protein EXIGLDRAFT_641802 [Exidia glandulosa HHB12029]